MNTLIIYAHAMISAVFSNAIIQIHIALEHYQSQYLNSAATDYVLCLFVVLSTFLTSGWTSEARNIN